MDKIAVMGIGTAVPTYCLKQEDVVRRLGEALKDRPDTARWAKRVFSHCGVDTRYTCEPNLLEPSECMQVSSFDTWVEYSDYRRTDVDLSAGIYQPRDGSCTKGAYR